MATDEETRLANNPTHPEAVAIMAERADAERIKRAHEPKRFIIRKSAPDVWAVVDQARPFWMAYDLSPSRIIARLEHADLLNDLPEWDGVVRIKLREPEPEPEPEWYEFAASDRDDWNE